MDWSFYGILFLVLFGFVTAILILRYLMNKRIERYERKRRNEKETQQISETNSGL